VCGALRHEYSQLNVELQRKYSHAVPLAFARETRSFVLYTCPSYNKSTSHLYTFLPTVSRPTYKMKSLFSSFLCVAGVLRIVHGLAVEKKAACNADNCLRAVRATANGPAHLVVASKDCSSFFHLTITPATR
jgi:hypothetical protein